MKKQEEEKKKKNDDMTDSDEDDPTLTEEQRKQLITAQKSINEYRFKRSFLYLMCWSDLNTHYGYKLLYYAGVAARRMIYAYSLVYLQDNVCQQIKYFVLLNICVRSTLLVITALVIGFHHLSETIQEQVSVGLLFH